VLIPLIKKTTWRLTVKEGVKGAGVNPELIALSFLKLSFFNGGGASNDAMTRELPVHVRYKALPVIDLLV
jgi:hypothetical protein